MWSSMTWMETEGIVEVKVKKKWMAEAVGVSLGGTESVSYHFWGWKYASLV